MTSSCTLTDWWSQAPADWAENERLCLPLYDAVLDVLELPPGSRLLDVGCGAGTALRAAAARGLRTAGLDTAEALLEVARGELPDGDLRIGDLCSLPFADESFDGVTVINAVQYAADPVTALREAARVGRTGARIAVVSWGDVTQCDSRRAIAALRGLVPGTAAGPQRGGSFGLSAPGRLAELFAAAGVPIQSYGDVAFAFEYPDLETAIRVQLASGPAQRTVATVGRSAAESALAEAMQHSRQPDGSFRQRNVFSFVIGQA